MFVRRAFTYLIRSQASPMARSRLCWSPTAARWSSVDAPISACVHRRRDRSSEAHGARLLSAGRRVDYSVRWMSRQGTPPLYCRDTTRSLLGHPRSSDAIGTSRGSRGRRPSVWRPGTEPMRVGPTDCDRHELGCDVRVNAGLRGRGAAGSRGAPLHSAATGSGPRSRMGGIAGVTMATQYRL
jgi:hypothetical protein